jgi:cell division protein FtsN
MNTQRGGTILGLIIGLVAGLALALAVAVYVTKVPVPFVNKGQTRSADQDAAEAKKNKDWNPNAPLYGKTPAGPANAASAAGGGAGAPAAVDAPKSDPTKTPPAVAGVLSKAAEGKSTSDPLGDLAKAKSSATATDPFTYFVQAGAFRSAEDAEAQRVKLSLAGVETKLTEREQSGRPIFRVRAGPFEQKEEADRIKEKVDAAGMDSALVRVQR